MIDLTPRHVEILRLWMEGCTSAEVARRLGISPYTARSHSATILRRLGARTRAQAVAVYLRG